MLASFVKNCQAIPTRRQRSNSWGNRLRFAHFVAVQRPAAVIPCSGSSRSADNAAMQAEPPKAEPPKRKRRWFQFSLRTLMIGVTLLAVGCWAVVNRQQLIREPIHRLQKAGRAI